MKNFGIGLALGLIGAMIWFIGIGLVACEEFTQDMRWPSGETQDYGIPFPSQSAEGETSWQSLTTKYGGFGLMVAGPVAYWIILPVIELVKRRRKR